MVYGPTHRVQSPLRSSDGTTFLTDKGKILDRWSEHFQDLFRATHQISDTSINRIPERPIKMELDDAITMEEVVKAINQLQSGKAAGGDGIPPEVWKNGERTLHTKFYELFTRCWEEGSVPQDLRDAVIITL